MVDIKKLCDELFKDSKSSYQTSTIFFTVADELEEKLTKEEYKEFVKTFAAIACKQKENEGMQEISAEEFRKSYKKG